MEELLDTVSDPLLHLPNSSYNVGSIQLCHLLDQDSFHANAEVSEEVKKYGLHFLEGECGAVILGSAVQDKISALTVSDEQNKSLSSIDWMPFLTQGLLNVPVASEEVQSATQNASLLTEPLDVTRVLPANVCNKVQSCSIGSGFQNSESGDNGNSGQTNNPTISTEQVQSLLNFIQTLAKSQDGPLQIIVQSNEENAMPSVIQVKEVPQSAQGTKVIQIKELKLGKNEKDVQKLKSTLEEVNGKAQLKRNGAVVSSENNVVHPSFDKLTEKTAGSKKVKRKHCKSQSACRNKFRSQKLEQEKGSNKSVDLESSTETPVAGFMEDYLEHNNGMLEQVEETVSIKEKQSLSVLESTVDETIIITMPKRVRRTLNSTKELCEIDLDATPSKDAVTFKVTKDGHILCDSKNEHPGIPSGDDSKPSGKTSKEIVYKYKCYYCDFGSEEKSDIVEHTKTEHPDKACKTRIMYGRQRREFRSCPYCGIRLVQKAFFQHMRAMHTDAHPFKCGYCSFMGRDINQVKHHVKKKHQLPFKCINLLKLLNLEVRQQSWKKWKSVKEGDINQYDYVTDDDVESELDIQENDPIQPRQLINCPVCSTSVRNYKSLKTHLKQHQKRRFKCGYCSYLSIQAKLVSKHTWRVHGDVEPNIIECDLDSPQVVNNFDEIIADVYRKCSRQPRDPDNRKWKRKFNCPHCDYTCNFGASYRRHLKMHENSLPYKCNYCGFKGREKYYVRRHIQRIHEGLPEIVLDNIPENCMYDSLSDEETDLQEEIQQKRQRKRFPGQAVHPVVPVDDKVLHDAGIERKPPVDEVTYKKKKTRKESTEDDVILNIFELHQLGDVVEEDRELKPSRVCLQNLVVDWNTDTSMADASGVVPSSESSRGICRVNEEDGSAGSKGVEEIGAQVVREYCAQPQCQVSECLVAPFSVERNASCVDDVPSVVSIRNKRSTRARTKIQPKKPRRTIWKQQNVKNFIQEKDKNHTTCICGVKTVTKAFYKHAKKHLNIKPYKCGHCNYRSIERAKIRVHNTFVHPDLPLHIEEDEVDANSLKQPVTINLQDRDTSCSSGSDKVILFPCFMCNKQVLCFIDSIMEHFFHHFSYLPYKCMFCGFLGFSMQAVQDHAVREHKNNTVLIEETGQDIPEGLQDAVNHFMVLLEKELAKKSDEEEDLLAKKQNSKPADKANKAFQCPICKKILNCHVNTVRRHFYVHYNYRPYQCGFCDYKGTSPGEIKQHTVIHGNVKPAIISSMEEPIEDLEEMIAKCMEDTKANMQAAQCSNFRGGELLQTVEGKAWCEALFQGECPWCVDGISSVQVKTCRHLKTHFNYKPFKCAYCDQRCTDRTDGRKHLLSMHQDMSFQLVGPVEDNERIIEGLQAFFKRNPQMLAEERSPEVSSDNGAIQGAIKLHDGTIEIRDALVRDMQLLLSVYSAAKVQFRREVPQWHKCPHCPIKFKKHVSLLHHKLNMHASGAPAYKCGECSYWNYNHVVVQRHVLSAHKNMLDVKIYSTTRVKKEGGECMEVYEEVDIDCNSVVVSEEQNVEIIDLSNQIDLVHSGDIKLSSVDCTVVIEDGSVDNFLDPGVHNDNSVLSANEIIVGDVEMPTVLHIIEGKSGDDTSNAFISTTANPEINISVMESTVVSETDASVSFLTSSML